MSGLLVVRDLRVETATAPARELLRGVSFEVAQGETTCVVGASGSGKSMSCLSVLGLLPKGVRMTSGEIVFNGGRLDCASPDELARIRGSAISMVMQSPMSCFDPIFSIESHFKETLRAHGIRGRGDTDRRIDSALAEVGFDDALGTRRSFPFQLSGGMLQRVMLAIALMLDPLLLIADEATSDLDTVAQSRVLDLIDDARRRRGMGVLLVTHDLGVAARMADQLVVMDGGEVVERGDVDELFSHPSSECARALLAAHGRLSARMREEEQAG